jgi:hypothetical protein
MTEENKDKKLSIRIHRMKDVPTKRGDRYYKSIGEMMDHILRKENMDEDYLLYPEQAHHNQHFVSPESIDVKKKRVEDAYFDEHRRAMPKNTSPYIDGLITFSDTMREDIEKYGAKKVVEESMKFLNQEFGFEHMVALSLHMDETTPHIHFIAMNWSDKKSRAYSQAYEQELKDAQGVSLLQDRLANHYKKNIPAWEYERGEHQNTKEYHSKRKAQEQHLKTQKERITLLENEKEELKGQIDQLKMERDSQALQIEEMKQEIVHLVESRDDLERQHIEQVKGFVDEFDSMINERQAMPLLRKLLRAAKSEDEERLKQWSKKLVKITQSRTTSRDM